MHKKNANGNSLIMNLEMYEILKNEKVKCIPNVLCNVNGKAVC